MSSYIVDDKTIDRIISVLKQSNLIDYIEGLCIVDLSDFGQELLNLNISAYDQRYGGKIGKYNYTFTECQVTTVQGLKSLRCLLYQCLEGDVPNTKLYKQMRNACGDLAQHIVEKLLAYENAEWA